MFQLILAAAVAAAQPAPAAQNNAHHGSDGAAHGQMCPECKDKAHAAMTAEECKQCCKGKPEAERAACMAQHGHAAEKQAGHHQH